MPRALLPRPTRALALTCSLMLTGLASAGTAPVDATLAERMAGLTRSVVWTEVASVPLMFPTFHPQGMTRVGDDLFMSSVEIIEPTQKFETPQDGYDRTPGTGKGHLFKFNLKGDLIASVELGEGDVYHPGGIDFDGESIWVSVAEYRPNSSSIVYRVDPATLAVTEVFRFADHLGGILRDPSSDQLHAVSWGSRRFYTFEIAADGSVPQAGLPRDELMVPNPAHYIDYQDCQLAGAGEAVCSGITAYSVNGQKFELGGLDLIDLGSGQPVVQVPVQIWTETGLVMTHNPVWLEPTATGLRAYFVPEDDTSRLFIYDAVLPR